MPENHVGPRAPTFIEVGHCPQCGTLNRVPELAPSSPEYWAHFAVGLDCRSRYRSQLERGRSGALGVGSVAPTCTICSHPKLVNIDRQLLRGDRLNGIAHRFHVSPDAVGRHRRHMRTAMLKAQAVAEKQDLVYGQTLIDEVKLIKADAERLQLEAEGRQDIRAALQAVCERVGIVELQAKLMGEIQTGNRSVTVNLQTISPQEALEYARDILELFSPDSALQPELPILLIAGDTDWFWHYDYLCEMLTL